MLKDELGMAVKVDTGDVADVIAESLEQLDQGELEAHEVPGAAGLRVRPVVRHDSAAVAERPAAASAPEVQGVPAPFVVSLPFRHRVHHEERGTARIVPNRERDPPLYALGRRDELQQVAPG